MRRPICSACSGPIHHRRTDAAYCSTACKSRAARIRTAALVAAGREALAA